MLIERGGKSEERLYLYDLNFNFYGEEVRVKKTDLPDMDSVIARHKARYFLPAFFCRPGMKILDFPCGSGYGWETVRSFNVHYQGRDIDPITIGYCQRMYAKENKPEYSNSFSVGDLRDPKLLPNEFNLIACIEGIEHIERKYQSPLIGSFLNALKPGGILVISTPETTGSPKTPYHLCELSEHEFKSLLTIPLVGFESVQILNHKEQGTNWLYGICRKGD